MGVWSCAYWETEEAEEGWELREAEEFGGGWGLKDLEQLGGFRGIWEQRKF